MASGDMMVVKREFNTFVQSVVKQASAVMPKHMTPERMAKLVYAAASKPPAYPNAPTLFDCTPASVGMAMMTCSELGLEPGDSKGHVYLIPRRNSKAGTVDCTLQIGYKGYAELGRRAGVKVDASVVYVGEPLMVSRTGMPPMRDIIEYAGDIVLQYPKAMDEYRRAGIWHSWKEDVDRSDNFLRAAYAIATLPDGSTVFEVMTRQELESHCARSGSKDSGPWVTDFARMCRKTPIRSLFAGGLVPMSAEILRALEIDNEDVIEVQAAARKSSAETLRQRVSIPEVAESTEGETPDDSGDPLASFRAELADAVNPAACLEAQKKAIAANDESTHGEIRTATTARLTALKP